MDNATDVNIWWQQVVRIIGRGRLFIVIDVVWRIINTCSTDTATLSADNKKQTTNIYTWIYQFHFLFNWPGFPQDTPGFAVSQEWTFDILYDCVLQWSLAR